MKMERRKALEHDVDILLVEETYASPEFRQWLVKQATGNDVANVRLKWARRSVSQSGLGESDVVFVYDQPSGLRQAILIENKISAPAQPTQGDRYRRRGQAGIKSNKWASFRTMILAPQEYLGKSADVARFDAQVSYEALREWFLGVQPGDDRMAYKAEVVKSGIERMKNGWLIVPDEKVTQFFRDYWQFSQQAEFRRLEMHEPRGVPKGNNEITFYPSELNRRRGLRLVHKFEKGWVDLMVAGASSRVDRLRIANQSILPSDVTVVIAAQSAAFRIVVPESMSREESFAGQEGVARKAMEAAIRLLELSFKLKGVRQRHRRTGG
jgi:hypothetical protein